LVQTKEEIKAKRKEYNDRPEVKARQKEYYQKPEVKARQKEYYQKPEVKAKKREYYQKPEVKAKQREYSQKPEVKAKKREYYQKPEVKVRQKQWSKVHQKEYNQRPEVKARHLTRRQRPEVKAKAKLTSDNIRLKVLQVYSKRLSNSDIPCCKCCNLNSYIGFLAIDHIEGRIEMDSIPELVKIGYSSKFSNNSLFLWIIKNNFPEGFQILCHNCNTAKGFYGKCPHETKRLEETFAMMEEQSSFEV
jgi:hypothetical protein